MDVIGDNIANTNTVGFKASRLTFTDALSQTQFGASAASNVRGGINPKQIGLGTGVASVDRLFSDAPAMSTGKNTDLALSGNAFFIVQNENNTYYTRNGAFEFDENGNLVLPGSGANVIGWTAKNGTINSSEAPSTITIPAGKVLPAKATEYVRYSNNLDSNILTIKKMLLTDNKMASIDVSSTDSYGIGDTISANVSNVSVTFNNGIVIPSATAGYANGTDYYPVVRAQLDDDTSISLLQADGSKNYTVGQTPSAPIARLTISTSIGFIRVDNSSTTKYSKASIAWLNDLTIVSGPTLNSSSSSQYQYEYRLSDGSTLSSDSNAYVIGAHLDDPTASGSATTSINYIWGHLSDGAPFIGGQGEYVIGERLSAISSFEGNIQDSNGNILENFSMNSGTVTPSSTVQPSNITLTTDIGKINVSQSDTETYHVGSVYNSVITSSQLTMSDDSVINVSPNDETAYGLGHSIPIQTTITIYDTLGEQHDVPILLEKTSTPGQWKASLATTSIQEPDGTTISFSMDDTLIKFNSSGLSDGQNSAILNINSSSAGQQTVGIDFSGLSQYASSTTAYPNSDGYTAGIISHVLIDDSGSIICTYTNGVRRNEAQIAVAQFNNPSGLTHVGNSWFRESSNSGPANIRVITAFGGSITPAALEMSNVDMANEFSDMIVIQRGYQSNSKIITSSDEFIETLINLKR